jgi:hypothetical protein
MNRAVMFAGTIVALASVVAKADTPPPPAETSEVPLDRLTFPTARSQAPQELDWQKSQRVELTRGDVRCVARRVREWIRIECFLDRVAGVHLVAGEREGVELHLVKEARDGSFDSTQIIFPVRARDRRVFQIVPATGDWRDGAASPMFISESWIDGESPQIVLSA